ncbi:ATP synthase F(1) complex subunit gamma, mitochondrial [Hippocampus comes]|uniref:ATP synthase F(1) complex subunit gamma, mitochondrial n=1 Tax=Hippocampus comes TaxID=109280 RepID=UPI00094F1F85|nr:PREDICTED: ATP synthase subunit gamma, mitochondrial-like [Hippocampus comes]
MRSAACLTFTTVNMLARTSALVFSPQCGQIRNMATLKDITIRLKSIKNIQKITKSMKMVAAAKYARAERQLKAARHDAAPARERHQNVFALSCVRTHGKHIMLNCKEVGRKPPTFGDASLIASELLNSGYEFDQGAVIYNHFRSVISYKTDRKSLFSNDVVANAETMAVYDDIDADVLRSYQEFAMVNVIYLALRESSTSEQSARMTAMDSASKNASEMIDKLTLTFNRTRQAVITKELIEIISGAAAL